MPYLMAMPRSPFLLAEPPTVTPPAPTSSRSYRTTALIIASALFMEQVDATVLATALPSMAQSFGVSPLAMSVALTSYLVSLAVFIPASGWVADRFGARRVFCAAILLFSLGSVLCAQATGLAFLVAARVVQGIGGAMMVPVGRLILLRSVAKNDLVNAMAWFLVPALIGPILGPPLGGAIVTYLSWRWIFYINLPFGAAGLILARTFIADVREGAVRPFDWIGLLLSGIALAAFTFGLEMSARGVLAPAATAVVLGTGVAAATLYLAHARHHDAPILEMRLMRVKTFALSVLGGALTRIAGGAMPFLLPMMMQIGFGMSAAQSGLITCATAAGALLMKVAATPLLKRYGFRAVLTWNSLLASGILALYATFRPSWPLAAIYAVLLAGGFFQSLQFTAYNTLAYADIDRRAMSAATSFYVTFQQLMLSAGISVAAATLHWSIRLSGETRPGLTDFTVAFAVVTAIAAAASLVVRRLPPSAGEVVSGHREAAQSHEP